MADKPVTLKFLTAVKHGFKANTPGFEAHKLGDDWVYEYKEFAEGDEFTFPIEELSAAKALVEDGVAVVVQ